MSILLHVLCQRGPEMCQNFRPADVSDSRARLPVLLEPERSPPARDCGRSSERGEVLLGGVLTLRFVSHAQPARLWRTVSVTDTSPMVVTIQPKSGS